MDEFSDEVIEFYMLSNDVAVLLGYDQHTSQLVQYRVSIDRSKREAFCHLERRVAFDAPMGIRVGIGAVTQGYVVVVGRTSRAEGDVCRVRLLAADPMHCADFSEFQLDDEVTVFVLILAFVQLNE